MCFEWTDTYINNHGKNPKFCKFLVTMVIVPF
jgi:hypothetical protein